MVSTIAPSRPPWPQTEAISVNGSQNEYVVNAKAPNKTCPGLSAIVGGIGCPPHLGGDRFFRFLLIPVTATFYPVPVAPADKFPLYFLAYMLVGVAWFTWLRVRSSRLVERIREDTKLERLS